MIIDCWVVRDESKMEYYGISDIRGNYIRPTSMTGLPSAREPAVYVAELGEFLKVGVSANPRHRIDNLQKHGEVGHVFIGKPSCLSRRCERRVLMQFCEYKLFGEFLGAEYKDVIEYIKTSFPFILRR